MPNTIKKKKDERKEQSKKSTPFLVEEISEYEKIRQRNIEQNKNLLLQLKLNQNKD